MTTKTPTRRQAKGRTASAANAAAKGTGKRSARKGKLRVDLGCGQSKQEGFVGVDISPASDADVIHDLWTFPWPFESDSVHEAFCSHVVEHIPFEVEVATLPAQNHHDKTIQWVPQKRDGLLTFMDEAHRILKKGARLRIIHPHSRSDRAFQDPTHRRFIPEATWYYFNKEWRKANKLDHYPVRCDFDIEEMFYNGFQDIAGNFNLGNWGQKSEQARQHALIHHWNVAMDLCVTLKKR